MPVKEIAASAAVKLFSGVTVQTARPVKVKDADGKERPGYKVEDERLRAEHILAAREHEDRVAITTIDGRKHEAPKSEKAAA